MALHDGGRRWADEHYDYGPVIGSAVDHISRVADGMGTRILYENTYRLVGPLVEAIGRAPSPLVGLLLDVGHANLGEGGVPAVHAAMRATGRLVAMHLHDNHGDRDDHLPLGSGTAELDGLEVPPYVIVEVRDWQRAVATREAFRQRFL
jgi:sugar phosphate isomerase/epimerase